MNKRQVPATHVRDSILNVMMGFAGKDNFVTIPLTFARFCDGDLIIAALFSQILYWTGVTDDPEGWIAKSYEDWHEELSLTRSQVDRSVKALEKIGLQTDKRRSRYHDFAPTIHYRFDKEILSAAANAFFADPVNGKQQMKGKHVSNLPSVKQKHLLNISKSQSLNINESEMLENNESYKETMEESIEENINTFATTSRGPVLSPNESDVSYPFVEQRLSSSVLAGENTPSTAPTTAQGKSKSTTPPNPPTPLPPAPNAAEALAVAMGMTPVGKDWGVFGKVAKELHAGTILSDEFSAYVEFWKARAIQENWRLTVTALTGAGRMSEYVAYRTRQIEMLKFARPEEPAPDPSEYVSKERWNEVTGGKSIEDLLKSAYGVDS